MIEIQGLVKSYDKAQVLDGASLRTRVGRLFRRARHDKVQVLDGVSLTIAAGERAALIGPSGGGKTTLLRCLVGLEPFEEGRMMVDDTCLTTDGSGKTKREAVQAIRRKVGMVFQQFHLFPHLSVLENVLCGPVYGFGRSREETECEARTLLARVGLGDKLREKPERLSGGQQQRVAIARALALQPRVLLLDEPTSALDPRNAREVVSLITDLARAVPTMLLVTHDVAFTRRVADTVHVMIHGRVIESGPARQVLDHPREKATQSFLGSVMEGG
jgi:polar amino acid transport system ATP-binding protein